MRLIKIILAIMCCTQAFAQSVERWQTTWNLVPANTPQLPPPTDPWKPAMWTNHAVDQKSTEEDVRKLAVLCRDGGKLGTGIARNRIAYLRAVKRLDIFPNDDVPPGTLLITDFEGTEFTDYPTTLCGTTLTVTRKFAQYPGVPNDGSVNFVWTSQMREVDFYMMNRGVVTSKTEGTMANKIRKLMGDYVIFELYLLDPKKGGNQDEQYRAWAIGLSAAHIQYPDKKILALVQGGYSWPGSGKLTDAERHRYARFVTTCFNCIWAWGTRDAAVPVMQDIDSLLKDPLYRFPGQESWPLHGDGPGADPAQPK